MIHALLIDDDKEAVNTVLSYCDGVQFIQVQKVVANFIEATRYLARNQVDLIFCSTDIQSSSCLEFVAQLNSKQHLIVFFSKVPDFAVDAFTLNAQDYLLKPLVLSRFNNMLAKVKEQFELRKNIAQEPHKFLQVRSEYSLVKILVNDILYIESLDDYIKIHLPGKKPILTLMSLKQVLTSLPSTEFIRVHRSFLVALNKIESVRGKVINLGITEVPIGKSYEAEFFKFYVNRSY